MTRVSAMDPAQVFLNEVMSRNQSMDVAMARGDSDIQQFYSDTAVFVTGGSGFLGKQLIEKLLRATKISKVFVLLRPKKGKTVDERLNAILQDSVFDKIREQQKDFADRIVSVEGDVAELRLGLSDKDWDTLADQVHVIFHVAATTRFDTSLRESTMINTRGTREALLLGKACKNLKCYVHVSTAFSHACANRVNSEILEDFYPTPVTPETMIKLAESLEETKLDTLAPGLIKNWPNSYAFSKAIAEEMVRSMSDDLPICVVRPAIVIHSNREPHPGWLDVSAVYGVSGLFFGLGMGVVHTILINHKLHLDLIPVDYVNNAIIAAGCATAKRRATGEKNLNIYSVTSTRQPCTIEKIISLIKKHAYPTPMAVAYTLHLRTNNPVMFWIQTWLLHLIPAYIMDGTCLLMGKKRQFVKLYSKAYNLMTALSFFGCHKFHFDDKNTEALYNSLSEVDQEIFNFDVNKIEWREYMVLWSLAIRRYILKDGLTGTEYAKKKQIFLKFGTYAAFMFYFFLLYKVFSLLFFVILNFISVKIF